MQSLYRYKIVRMFTAMFLTLHVNVLQPFKLISSILFDIIPAKKDIYELGDCQYFFSLLL